MELFEQEGSGSSWREEEFKKLRSIGFEYYAILKLIDLREKYLAGKFNG